TMHFLHHFIFHFIKSWIIAFVYCLTVGIAFNSFSMGAYIFLVFTLMVAAWTSVALVLGSIFTKPGAATIGGTIWFSGATEAMPQGFALLMLALET
ncbi:hypothetical protein PFISCL1PPCAC_3119, partial [Pristionchus fissidentatus]